MFIGLFSNVCCFYDLRFTAFIFNLQFIQFFWNWICTLEHNTQFILLHTVYCLCDSLNCEKTENKFKFKKHFQMYSFRSNFGQMPQMDFCSDHQCQLDPRHQKVILIAMVLWGRYCKWDKDHYFQNGILLCAAHNRCHFVLVWLRCAQALHDLLKLWIYFVKFHTVNYFVIFSV